MDRDSNIQNYLSADRWVTCLKCSIYMLHIGMETDEERKYCLRMQQFEDYENITGVPSCNIFTKK